MPLRKDRSVLKDAPLIVPRVPGTIAFNDLLERITDHGMEVEGGSKLTAMDHVDQTHLQVKAKILTMPLDGAAARRRGAPLPRRGH